MENAVMSFNKRDSCQLQLKTINIIYKNPYLTKIKIISLINLKLLKLFLLLIYLLLNAVL